MCENKLEERIDDLEMKLTFQDQIIEELNQSLIQQQNDFRKFTRILESLSSQVESIGQDNPLSNTIEPPPPHY